MHHDRCHGLDDVAPAAALGALDVNETAALHAHLATCRRRHPPLRDFVALAAAIGGAVPDLAEPPAGHRERLLAALHRAP